MSYYDTFIGSYGEEDEETIHWLRFFPEKESFEKVFAVTGIANPSFVTVNHAQTHLYAVSELDEGEVVSYEIDYDAESLRELNSQPTKGGPCFVEVSPDDRYLFTANYGGGSVIVHPLKDGEIQPYSDFVEYDSTKVTSNAHAIKHIPGTKGYVVTDLGHDTVNIYEHAKGKLEEKLKISVEAGAGPRHIAFYPALMMMYVLHQDNSSIDVFRYSKGLESLEHVQNISTLLEPFAGTNYAADIHVAGNFVYASNRGHHSITGYRITEAGTLEEISNISSGGDWPRNFGIVPHEEQMIVANEHTNELVLMEVLENGQLQNRSVTYDVQRPVCVHFLK